MTYVRVTNETLTTTLNESAVQVFWIVSYEFARQQKEEQYIKARMRK